MNVKAEALAILDRWLKSMDDPDNTPPLEIHHKDLDLLREAIGPLPDPDTVVRKRAPCSGRLPTLTVSRSQLYLNPPLTDLMQASLRVRVEVEDGRPVIYPDRNGWKVTITGTCSVILAPTQVKHVHNHLPVGSKWLMTRDAVNNRWVGQSA